MRGIALMIAAMMQMFDNPLKEETIFDISFEDWEIREGGYCQVQFYQTPRDGFDAIGVDWGDGTVQEWPKSRYNMAHNWTKPGRYRVKFDKRLKWFRFTECWTVTSDNKILVSRPAVFPIQWGDFVESAQGTFCAWNNSEHGGGVQGPVIPWGKSIKSVFCCYQFCVNITGGFPKWGPSVTDCTGAFDGCTGLGGAIPPWPKNATECDQCYQNTGATGIIPAWPETMESVRMCYKGCKSIEGAWTDDPELLMPPTINHTEGMVTAHDEVVTDASDALRALFYEDWGGTRTRPE